MMDKSLNFKPRQIVSLRSEETCLYAEVIQIVVSRQLCWARPLFLVTLNTETQLVTDLRGAADLVWPIHLFQLALDTEVIPLFSFLESEPPPDLNPTTQQQLSQFVNLFWQSDKSQF